MRGIVADVNIEGHVTRLVELLESGEWADYWPYMNVALVTFAGIGLEPHDPDRDVWRACQRESLVLITANRNDDGPDSLAATIAEENEPSSLPVLTISNALQVLRSAEYAVRVATRLIDYLLEIDAHRGTGRLYLP